MSDAALGSRSQRPAMREPTRWEQLRANRDWLGFWFMAPAIGILTLFLAYPLFLGVWLSFTDTKIGPASRNLLSGFISRCC
jgi:multiple sugar transport system permease protein